MIVSSEKPIDNVSLFGYILRRREGRKTMNEFQELLDFVNQELNQDNWKEQISHACGLRDRFVTYRTAKGLKKEKMLDFEIYPNVGAGLFGEGIFKDSTKLLNKIDEAIEKNEIYIPKLKGKPATFQSTKNLHAQIRGFLTRMVDDGKNGLRSEDAHELNKEIELASGFRVERELIMLPDGQIICKNLIDGNEDASKVLYFQAARLLNQLSISNEADIKRDHENYLASKSSKSLFKPFKRPIQLQTHGLDSCRKELPDKPLKLLYCRCGCGSFILQNGKRKKDFLDYDHRNDFHNKKRGKSGEKTDYSRKWRKKNPGCQD
jgi:hypothetical protein